MTTLYTRNDVANNIANDKTINATDLDGEFDAIETAFAGLEATMSITGINANFLGTVDVTGAATLDSTLTVVGTSGFTGQATFADLVATTADINAGTIDNTIIGGTTAVAGSFTTLGATGTSTLATVDINGGAIDGTTVGSTTPAAGAFTTLTASSTATFGTVDINGGAIDGTPIGANSASTGAFTNITASGTLSVDGALTSNTSVTVDRTGDDTWARLIFDADATRQQSVNFTNSGGTVYPGLKYFDDTDIVTVGNSSLTGTLIELGSATIANSGNDLDITGNTVDLRLIGANGYVVLGNSGQLYHYAPISAGSTNIALFRSDSGSTENNAIVFKANGDINTLTGSIGTISDQRLKENIVDANSQWEDVKAIRFRNYNLIGHEETMLGVVTQELLAAGMNGLVGEDEDGTQYAKLTVLLLKCAVALQEAMLRIEELEDRVGALEES